MAPFFLCRAALQRRWGTRSAAAPASSRSALRYLLAMKRSAPTGQRSRRSFQFFDYDRHLSW